MDGIRKMNKAVRVLKCFVNTDINIRHIELLLNLAENDPIPVSFLTLSKLTSTTTANITWNLSMLSGNFHKDPTNGDRVDTGHGLVKISSTPYGTRENVAFLTDKGIKLVWMLNEIIK